MWMAAKEMIVVQDTGNLHKETFESTGFGKPSKMSWEIGATGRCGDLLGSKYEVLCGNVW